MKTQIFFELPRYSTCGGRATGPCPSCGSPRHWGKCWCEGGGSARKSYRERLEELNSQAAKAMNGTG